MCELVTITTLSAYAVSSGYKAYSAHKQGKYEEAVAQQQQQVQEAAGADALARGAAEAGAVRMEGSRTVGAARTAYAASGVDLSSGSVQDTLADSRMMAELDAQTVGNNAAREAWGFQVGANTAKLERTLARKRRQSAMTGSLFDFGGQAAIGGANLYANRNKQP